MLRSIDCSLPQVTFGTAKASACARACYCNAKLGLTGRLTLLSQDLRALRSDAVSILIMKLVK
jgi:hypothetical protein